MKHATDHEIVQEARRIATEHGHPVSIERHRGTLEWTIHETPDDMPADAMVVEPDEKEPDTTPGKCMDCGARISTAYYRCERCMLRTETADALKKARGISTDLWICLRDAHETGTAMESLLLLPMIRRAAELTNEIEALMNARESDKGKGE